MTSSLNRSQIGNLEILEELRLDGNQMTDLPAQIQNLKFIQKLRLHFTGLTRLPEGVSVMDNLTWLSVHHSPIVWRGVDVDIGAVVPKNVLFMAVDGTNYSEGALTSMKLLLSERVMVIIPEFSSFYPLDFNFDFIQ